MAQRNHRRNRKCACGYVAADATAAELAQHTKTCTGQPEPKVIAPLPQLEKNSAAALAIAAAILTGGGR